MNRTQKQLVSQVRVVHQHTVGRQALFSLWILLLSVALFLSACNQEVTESSTSVSDSASSENSIPTSSDHVIQTNEFQGQTVRVFTAAVNSSYVTELGDNSQNEHCATAISAAINDRTLAVEADYGIQIEETILIDPKRYNGTFLNAVREFAVSNTGEYDIYYPCLLDAGTMAMEGLLVDLAANSGLRTQNTWWDQVFIQDISISGSVYYLTGDIGLRAKNASGAMYFNKALFDRHGIAYPYDDVRCYNWTIDRWIEIIKQADMSEDLNNDRTITYRDQFSSAVSYGDISKLFYGAGERIAKLDETGAPYLSMYNQRSSQVVEKILTLLQNKTECVHADEYFSDATYPGLLLMDAFMADRCMFYSGSIEDALKLNGMNSDFGLLPTPMYAREQEQYYTLVSAWSANAYCIPYGMSDQQTYRAEVILDALGAYSVDTLAKTYYDVVLQYQKLRTDDDIEMLEIIFNGTGIDFGMVYPIGGLSGMLSGLITSPSGTFTSSFDALRDAAQSDLNDIIQKFEQTVHTS